MEGIRLAYERQVSEYLDVSAENPPLKEAGTSRREERSAVEERPQAAEAEAAEPVEPATAPEEAPYADPAVEAVPATETPGGVEETAPDDTAAGFPGRAGRHARLERIPPTGGNRGGVRPGELQRGDPRAEHFKPAEQVSKAVRREGAPQRPLPLDTGNLQFVHI